MVMGLQVLKELRQQYVAKSDDETVKKIDIMIKEMEKNLKLGYEKLVGFETSEFGFEWFGAAPGHEALTSYGILQFIQMAEVLPEVDRPMIKRSTDWLMSRKMADGSGQFKLNEKALDTFGRASQDITDAYILWTLTQLDEYNKSNHKDEISRLEKVALNSYDPYLLGLAAGTFYNI